jgi:sugar phosphate isomerase/epimerase
MAIYVSDWKDLARAVPLADKYGVGIEVLEFADPGYLDNSPEWLERIRGENAGSKMKSLHGPFCDLAPGSRDAEIRRVTKARFIQACGLAHELGIGRVVFHSGFIPKVGPEEEWLENAVAFWRDFIPSIPDGMEIHIENVWEDDYGLLRDLVDKIGAKSFSICLDTGHVGCNSSRTLPDWIGSLAGRIGHVHLNNNNGKLDDHLPLDRGKIDMAEALALLSEFSPNASWTVEMELPNAEVSLAWMREKGFV